MRSTFALAAVLAVSLAGAAQAAPFSNGGFEDNDTSPPASWSLIGSGLIIDDAAAYEGDQFFVFTRRSLPINGYSNGTLTQSFDIDATDTNVKVSFVLSANPFAVGNGVAVRTYNDISGWSAPIFYALSNPLSVNWQVFEAVVYSGIGGATSGAIEFTSFSFVGTTTGALLDGVQVTAVPLPMALPLFAAGLGALGLVKRRRKTSESA